MADSMEEFRELFLRSMADLTEKVIALGERVDTLSHAVQSVQEEFDEFRRTPRSNNLPPIEEGDMEGISDEEPSNAEEVDRASTHSREEQDALQLLLTQFANSQREERRLRTQEFQALMGLFRPVATPPAQPLVRNAPNFTKYDGKCDHAVVAQFIHQFVAHFPLAKITDPQDKVHLAAPHLTGEAVPWWQHWSELHTDPSTQMPRYDWDTFVSDFKQRFLPPQFLTDLEDEFAILQQKGTPVLVYSNKLLTLAQQIGTPEKEKLRAFIRGLDSSIKFSIRNLNPKTYEDALALAQNKEKELHGGKPKQAASGASTSTANQKSQADKTGSEKGKNGQPKQTPDEKATAGVQGGFLSEEERKAYMSEQRCFFCHTKGHRKQDCPKWKAKNATSQASSSISAVTPASQAPTTDTPQQ